MPVLNSAAIVSDSLCSPIFPIQFPCFALAPQNRNAYKLVACNSRIDSNAPGYDTWSAATCCRFNRAGKRKQACALQRQPLGAIANPLLQVTTSEVHPPGCQLHDKEQVDSDQPTLGPDFDRREVDGSQDIPMGLQEALPCRLSLSIRCGIDAMSFQDASDTGTGLLPALND